MRKLIIGQNGILSTPAASHLVRKMKATGAILLTASPNPGGPEKNFGIKIDLENGAPAPASVTNKIYETSKTITEYKIADNQELDVSKIGNSKFSDKGIEVVDSVEDYFETMKEIFDFEQIKTFLKNSVTKFSFLFDALNGVTGPYAKRIFEEELGIENCLQNATPLEDFGGLHPDPECHVSRLIVDAKTKGITLGAASDTDGSRHLIYDGTTYINPSDSIAVIAHYSGHIKYFKQELKGLARTFATSPALDLVTEQRKLVCYETPIGWNFFYNLFDAGIISISGEESLTGSDHIREPDGIWAVLAWLNIFAALNEKTKSLKSLKDIMDGFWKEYGRYYCLRYDYENVDTVKANKVKGNFEEMDGIPRPSRSDNSRPE